MQEDYKLDENFSVYNDNSDVVRSTTELTFLPPCIVFEENREPD